MAEHISPVPNYWFNTCMNHIEPEADQFGEVIPRIKVFLRRNGDLRFMDKAGESLMSKAQRCNLKHVVKFLENCHQVSEKLKISAMLTEKVIHMGGILMDISTGNLS